MPKIESSKTILSKGKGKPDYQAEIYRAKIEADVLHSLHYNESFKMFYISPSTEASLFPFVTAPLVSGATAALIDIETGLAMPYTSAIGFELQVLMIWVSFNQNSRQRIYMGTPPVPPQLAIETYLDAFSVFMENNVVPTSTADIDPDFEYAHTLLGQGTNLGVGDMSGSTKIICILRDMATDLPITKTVKCKWCGHKETVKLDITLWKCPKCGKQTMFAYHPWGGS